MTTLPGSADLSMEETDNGVVHGTGAELDDDGDDLMIDLSQPGNGNNSSNSMLSSAAQRRQPHTSHHNALYTEASSDGAGDGNDGERVRHHSHRRTRRHSRSHTRSQDGHGQNAEGVALKPSASMVSLVTDSRLRRSDPRRTLAIKFLFAVCGLSVFARSESVLLQTHLFSRCFGLGDSFYPLASCAIFIPGIFVQIFQASFGTRIDRKFGTSKATTNRLTVAVVVSTLVLIALIVGSYYYEELSKNYGFIYSLLVILGLGISISFGSFVQIVSLFPPSLHPFFFIGTYSPFFIFAPVNIAVGDLCVEDIKSTWATRWNTVLVYYILSIVITLCGLFCFYGIVKHPLGKYLIQLKDQQLRQTYTVVTEADDTYLNHVDSSHHALDNKRTTGSINNRLGSSSSASDALVNNQTRSLDPSEYTDASSSEYDSEEVSSGEEWSSYTDTDASDNESDGNLSNEESAALLPASSSNARARRDRSRGVSVSGVGRKSRHSSTRSGKGRHVSTSSTGTKRKGRGKRRREKKRDPDYYATSMSGWRITIKSYGIVLSQVLTTVSSALVASLYIKVKATRFSSLPTLLIYNYYICGAIGIFLTSFPAVKRFFTQKMLLLLSTVRLVIVPLMILYKDEKIPQSDIGLLVVNSVQMIISGFIFALCFSMASDMFQNKPLCAQASTIVNVSYYISMAIGLGISLAIV